MAGEIVVRGARLHNLKNVNLSIPKDQLVVLTGLSGSGKSTLSFDILLKEGMRQYLEAVGMVTLGLAKAPVDSITGLAPTISVDQHLTNRSPRSTVGTSTEVYAYLRVLFARLGRRPCPHCGQEIAPYIDPEEDDDWPAEAAGEASLGEVAGEAGSGEASLDEPSSPCPHCGAPVPDLTMAHFSFNKPEGACPACSGLGVVHQVDLGRLVDEQKSLPQGAVQGWDGPYLGYISGVLQAAVAYYGIPFNLDQPVKDYTPAARDLLFYGVENPLFRRHFPQAKPPASARQGRFEGAATSLLRRYAEHIQAHAGEANYADRLEEFLASAPCPACGGARLRPESRAVSVGGQSIVALAGLPLSDLFAWLEALGRGFSAPERRLAGPLVADLAERISRLLEVGVGYLSLERGSPSVSAGEAQRLRLASLLGSSLSGMLYIFDEPTIGLHQRDTHRLTKVLRRLRDLGNTVLVVEHDLEMIAAADTIIDFGPGAGKHGGQVVGMGTPESLAQQPASITGAYLAGRAKISLPEQRRAPGERALTIRGARHNNLQDLSVRLPLGLLVAVTGVSGSGKSSLVFDILDRALRRRLYGAGDPPGEHAGLEGAEWVEQVITIDQEYIVRVPRSNAATYTDVFTPIRNTFAATPQARQLGLTARHFSFNVPGGRCERCEGAGVLAVKMQLLPDVEVRCPVCHGRRFTRQTLAVTYRGRTIAQALDLTVEEALELFAEVPAAAARLQVLSDVGLGYLQLGQSAATLSGGEAQRVKLAKELGRRARGRTLYLLDEPTTGLHLDDTARLLRVLQRLVDGGSSVIVVEHNLELVKAADWVIDLGPEGGSAGGRLVAEGTPEQVAQVESSLTGQWLKRLLPG